MSGIAPCKNSGLSPCNLRVSVYTAKKPGEINKVLQRMPEIWEQLTGLMQSAPPAFLSALMFAVGLLLLFFGWQTYRISWVVIGVLVGGAIGTGIAFTLDIVFEVKVPALVFALPLGIILGLLTHSLQKVGAFLVGGLCGAVPLLASQHIVGTGAGVFIAAGAAFILGGILAVLLWRPMIIVSFSVVGAFFIAQGALLASDCFESVHLRELVARHPLATAGAVILLTLVGVYFQTLGGEKPPEEKKAKENA